MTRLQARISSLERAAGLRHHSLSLPTKLSHSTDLHPTVGSAPPSPKGLPLLLPPTHPPTVSSHIQPPRSPKQVCSLSFADSSLDLPDSVKATLREALNKQPWESSSTSVCTSSSVEQSWQGLSALETSAASDLSFNPLTYMAEGNPGAGEEVQGQSSESRRDSESTLVGQEGVEEVEDMSTLTGILRFVNQTLAKQDNPSVWSSNGLEESGDGHRLQVTTWTVGSYMGLLGPP